MRVRTIFESPPNLGFLASARLSGMSGLPPRTIYSTGGGLPGLLSSSAPRLALSSAAPLCESMDEPLQPISHRLLGCTPHTGHVPGICTRVPLSVGVGGSGGGGGGGQLPLTDVSPDNNQPDHCSGCKDPRWDANDHHSFQYPPSRCQIAEIRNAKPYEWGTTWTHFQVDPLSHTMHVACPAPPSLSSCAYSLDDTCSGEGSASTEPIGSGEGTLGCTEDACMLT
jgi:hypothetical protein